MKKITFALILVLFTAVLFASQNKKDNKIHQTNISERRKGVAIIMTGAARIPQEAALLEELYNWGLLKNVVFISGVSSGALNAVI